MYTLALPLRERPGMLLMFDCAWLLQTKENKQIMIMIMITITIIVIIIIIIIINKNGNNNHCINEKPTLLNSSPIKN